MAQIRANESTLLDRPGEGSVSVLLPNHCSAESTNSCTTVQFSSPLIQSKPLPNCDSRFEGALQSDVGHDLYFWFYLTGSAMQMLP